MFVRFLIDSLDFVRNTGIHRDKIPLSELVRLHEFLIDQEGELIYKISGYFDKNTKPNLHLEIKGEIHLRCQRCLDKLTHGVNLQNFFLLAENETELDQIDDDDTIDAILASSNLDVLDLIEEEIILSLPISPCHSSDECKIYLSDKNTKIDASTSTQPFAVLASFKNKLNPRS